MEITKLFLIACAYMVAAIVSPSFVSLFSDLTACEVIMFKYTGVFPVVIHVTWQVIVLAFGVFTIDAEISK